METVRNLIILAVFIFLSVMCITNMVIHHDENKQKSREAKARKKERKAQKKAAKAAEKAARAKEKHS